MTRAFSAFHKRDLILLGGAALAAGCIYLLTSALVFRVGFPLDDAWIHLTFARNLALHGQWAFRLGTPSAGSTSPLWSAALALGFLLRLAPYVWTYLLGASVLWALSVVCETTARRLLPAYAPRLPWVGLFIIVEWHLLWSALSGMETLLHALIAAIVLSAVMLKSRRYLTLGLIVGVGVWARPDGLTLLAPLCLAALLNEADNRSRLKAVAQIFIGFGAIFLCYLFFNYKIGGTPMPNTFYAKQAEYAAWQARPLLERVGQLTLQLLIGPSFLLVPGVVVWVVRSWKLREWGSLLALTWSLGYMLLYIMRLPAYQHGRYLIPAMPIFFLIGLLGALDFFSRNNPQQRRRWFVTTLWQVSLYAVTILFVALGADSYARDVELIEQEMVESAKWAQANLPPNAIIAAHDIGALGYFDSHPLLDLAGLISPEVVPFIRNEPRLADYLNQNDADYVVAFSDLYKTLTLGKEIVFETRGELAQSKNYAPMTIYRWK
ncbi:MAG: hypothetical protein LC099_01475 [Anaerolineales bacterium]|nr:hypothetical protein [Anaerolineales bacterium]